MCIMVEHCTTSQTLESNWTLLFLFAVPQWLSCSIFILPQQAPKPQHHKAMSAKGMQHKLMLKLLQASRVHQATNRCQVLLYLPWKFKLPARASELVAVPQDRVWETWPYGEVLQVYLREISGSFQTNAIKQAYCFVFPVHIKVMFMPHCIY